MKLSIVIVNRNTCQLLCQCLNSIYAHQPGFEFEIWVVDNNSYDGSQVMIREDFPQVLLIENPVNIGFARANNQVMRRAQGDFFLLLNSDTIVKTDALEGMVTVADRYPQAGILGCKLLNLDGSLQASWARFPTLVDEISGRNVRRRRLVDPSCSLYKVDWVSGACLLVRREAVEQIGMLDETFFMYSEEVDWCYRMSSLGWNTYYLESSEIIHLGGGSAPRSSSLQLIRLYSAKLHFFQKNYGVWQTRFLRASLILVNLIGLLRRVPGGIIKAYENDESSERMKSQWHLVRWLIVSSFSNGSESQIPKSHLY